MQEIVTWYTYKQLRWPKSALNDDSYFHFWRFMSTFRYKWHVVYTMSNLSANFCPLYWQVMFMGYFNKDVQLSPYNHYKRV